MQVLPSQGHRQSWDPRLQSGLWGSPVLPNTCNLSTVGMSRLPAACQPSDALKRGQASQYLSPGGDFQSPHSLLCPSNGALPNCLLSPPCPAGSLPCSLPEPGRLIKPCAVLAQGMNAPRFRSIWHRNSPRTAASAAATDLTNSSCRY